MNQETSLHFFFQASKLRSKHGCPATLVHDSRRRVGWMRFRRDMFGKLRLKKAIPSCRHDTLYLFSFRITKTALRFTASIERMIRSRLCLHAWSNYAAIASSLSTGSQAVATVRCPVSLATRPRQTIQCRAFSCSKLSNSQDISHRDYTKVSTFTEEAVPGVSSC